MLSSICFLVYAFSHGELRGSKFLFPYFKSLILGFDAYRSNLLYEWLRITGAWFKNRLFRLVQLNHPHFYQYL